MAKNPDRAVGRYQERKNAEALRAVVVADFGIWARGVTHEFQCFGGVTPETVDQRLIVCSSRALKAKQPEMSPRSHNAAGNLDMNRTIALEPKRSDFDALEAFPRQRLDGEISQGRR